MLFQERCNNEFREALKFAITRMRKSERANRALRGLVNIFEVVVESILTYSICIVVHREAPTTEATPHPSTRVFIPIA